ncbi:MAG: DUF5679 domain-containing protein [Thermofilum sp.]|nr:DUF5679 domain-containing protein [Thermofilum sp.]
MCKSPWRANMSHQKITAYCVKCRKTVEMKNPQQVTLKNGRLAYKGTCPTCGTTVYRFVGRVKQ